MDKKTKNEKSKSKKKKIVRSFKNNNLKTSSKLTDDPKAENSNQKNKLNQSKSKNKDQKKIILLQKNIQ